MAPDGYLTGIKLARGACALLKTAHAGIHLGRIAIRAHGSFKVGVVEDVNRTHCWLLQHGDPDGKGRCAYSPSEGPAASVNRPIPAS